MTERQTVVRVTVETSAGWLWLKVCDSMATADYYLAYVAASTGWPVVEVIPDHVYRIGGLTYVLTTQQLLTTRAVGRLRKALEGQLTEPKTRAD